MAKRTSKCRRCGKPIERVTGKDPYWRHVGLIWGIPHGASPAR